MAEEVMAAMGVEVQVKQLEETKIIATTMARLKRWSLHHTVLEETNKVQHVTQLRNRSHMMSKDNEKLEMI